MGEKSKVRVAREETFKTEEGATSQGMQVPLKLEKAGNGFLP